MKKLLLLLVLSTPSTVMAQGGPEEETSRVFERFLNGLTNLEIDQVVDLFSDQALFWGTSSTVLVRDTGGIQAYFSALTGGVPGQNIASAVDYRVEVLSDGLSLLSGTWQVKPASASNGTLLRVSMVVALRNGEWKIIQFHNSGMPG